MHWTRRRFLAATAAGLGPLPGVLLRAAEQLKDRDDGHVLVVVQLTGGNDGLNSVVPFEDPIYHRSRPSLAVAERSVVPLEHSAGGCAIGLHPQLSPLRELYDEGVLTIVQGVGYPNPSRSHFRAMDTWHSGRPGSETATDGWLGRALGEPRPGRAALDALHLGDEELPLALAGPREVATLQNLDWLDSLATARGKETRERLLALHRVERGAERSNAALERVRALATSTLESLDGLLALRSRAVPVEYPDNALAGKLRWVGQLVAGGFPARILYTSLSGFDTHARQGDLHARLLNDLSGALRAFYRHLEGSGERRRVSLLVFSEFGRRLQENGSLGTDHGAAAPVLLLSAAGRGGVVGSHPALDDLEDGDVRYRIDFRRTYAALLETVLDVRAERVLTEPFAPLELFR